MTTIEKVAMAHPSIVPASVLGGAAALFLVAVTSQVTRAENRQEYTSIPADQLLQQPVSSLQPGMVAIDPGIANPLANDPSAAQLGMELFNSMNCVGCHAPNGAGGMGPALSNSKFIYGSKPAQIYLSIAQGRPNGMPAWGTSLPDQAIWQLVSYIEGISNEPQSGTWGQTVSRAPQNPSIEQVGAEYQTTTTPWDHTQVFSNGRAPFTTQSKP
jgi:cytochrome c oxidase cbb3-type subunit 3